MRKISANYIFPISSKPLKNGIVVTENDGTILDIIDTNGKLPEIEALEFYNGILTPGFVNAHCHLELSYLKGKFENLQGLPDFIAQIIRQRNDIPGHLNEILQAADDEMQAEGIVAVGDIINSNTSLSIKSKSSIFYHSFIELFNLSAGNTQQTIDSGLQLLAEANAIGLSASIVPHAPYSVSDELFTEIKKLQDSNPGWICSVHNQETHLEKVLFNEKSGKLFEMLQKMGTEFISPKYDGQRAIAFLAEYLPEKNNALLVHNTFTELADIEVLNKIDKNFFWVLCPKSNLLIENTLPNIEILRQSSIPLCIGTDSYASNNRLSILEEMLTLTKHFPEIELTELLTWATLNGARALNCSEKIGSLEKNKKPGINLITGIDFSTMSLTEQSKVKKLI